MPEVRELPGSRQKSEKWGKPRKPPKIGVKMPEVRAWEGKRVKKGPFFVKKPSEEHIDPP